MLIHIRIHTEGLLRNQRHAFSNRYTLVSELLQNARRAGATRIDIHHDADAGTLSVQDDGQGLADFQKLLSLHESGWDEATCREEQPFGVGFSKCLYAASRCIVRSGNRWVDIDTAAALAGHPVEVHEIADEAPLVSGTRIELHGVDLPELPQRIEDLCIGFAVPVWFNGQAVARPMAEAALEVQPCEIGQVHLAGTHDGRYSHDTWVFLQGFCVLRPVWSARCGVNVVHLDARQFIARLPDRDRLIDEDLQRRRIDAELKACWRRTLLAAKANLSPVEFIDRYHPALRAWGQLDLMNDIDLLPKGLCSAITGYPVQEAHGSHGHLDRHLSAMTRHITRQDLASGAVQLVALDAVGDDNGARWMLARHKGWLVFDWLGVYSEHWAMPHVRFLEEEPLRVAAVGETARTALDGRWVQPTVILCNAVRVRLGADEAMITDAGVAHEGDLYIPAGETSGRPVLQLSSFNDGDDHLQAADVDADLEALAELLQLLRSVDPVQTLDALLQALRLGRFALLQGKTFQLSVGVGAEPGHAVSLVDTHETGAAHAAR